MTDLIDMPPTQPEKRTNERTETHARDLISRAAAIDALIAEINEKPETYWDNGLNVYDVESVLKGLPSAQPEQRWIPVSERLPDEYEYVLLCDIEPDEDTGYSRIAVGWLEDGKICCWDDRATRDDFVAWMPLPEPWKGENNG